MLKTKIASYKAFTCLVEAQLIEWPEHADFLEKSFINRTEEELIDGEDFAQLISKISEKFDISLSVMADDYRFFCQEMILKEELFFRRHKRYRLSSFEEAYKEVYSNPVLMKRYMNGLLLSGLFWSNHATALSFYIHIFLENNKPGYKHLEVGPGHGTLLYFACKDDKSGEIYGWDVSPEAVETTKRTLSAFGTMQSAQIICQDIFNSEQSDAKFDSVVISEVLEHLEEPLLALKKLHATMVDGGRIYVNMPTNSPSPDHIFLVKHPDEVIDLVKNAGFEIEQYKLFPMTGQSTEKALKFDLTINCVVIARK